jgi:hypothetical protein
MTEPSLTTLIDIGDEIQGDQKWNVFVDGGDGFFYGIPWCARRVVKFNPLDKSFTEIGLNLGEGENKWLCGVRFNNSNIYCAPFASNHILKNDTIDGTELGLKLPSKGVKRRIVACLLNGRMDG